MDCSNCGHLNPDDNAFCEECGAPIGQLPTAAQGTTPTAAQAAPADGYDQPAELRQPDQPAPGQADRQSAEQPQPQPKKSRAGAIVAVVVGAAVVLAGVLFAISTQRQADLPVVYGSFSDSRPASDDHGQFLSFNVEEDAASSNGAQHFAVITAEWVPGKYDLDGYEVELENDHIDIAARVALQDEGDTVAFTPAETLSAGVDWQVSGRFDSTSVTLEEGYWTIETSDGQNVPVLVDHLNLPYGNISNA